MQLARATSFFIHTSASGQPQINTLPKKKRVMVNLIAPYKDQFFHLSGSA